MSKWKRRKKHKTKIIIREIDNNLPNNVSSFSVTQFLFLKYGSNTVSNVNWKFSVILSELRCVKTLLYLDNWYTEMFYENFVRMP